MQKNDIILFPQRICETLSGNLAHTVGRLVFRPGRPMLVEHVGGIYLEHDLLGRVITAGYGAEYNIAHVWKEEDRHETVLSAPRSSEKVFFRGSS
ncbi:MAG: hypothetical protein V1721_05965 [Pseudomonadota bacterium]